MAVVLSFTNYSGGARFRFVALKNYAVAFADENFYKQIRHLYIDKKQLKEEEYKNLLFSNCTGSAFCVISCATVSRQYVFSKCILYSEYTFFSRCRFGVYVYLRTVIGFYERAFEGGRFADVKVACRRKIFSPCYNAGFDLAKCRLLYGAAYRCAAKRKRFPV